MGSPPSVAVFVLAGLALLTPFRASLAQDAGRDARLEELERKLEAQSKLLQDQASEIQKLKDAKVEDRKPDAKEKAAETKENPADPKTPPPPEKDDAGAPRKEAEPEKERAWYDRMSIRGYVQLRYHQLASDKGGPWFHPGDRTVAENTTVHLRRARIILSGDITDHLYLYIQPDLNAAPFDGDFALQMRDCYADVAIDSDKEFRFRFGQSKVPYGFVNMQSSQNRLPLERPEALNSAVETERDIGVFFYWAPSGVRKLFRKLVADGLKGSGDYGVIGVGAYSGQGPNRLDRNREFHFIARATYPIELGGQIFELGVQGYTGRFVTRVGPTPGIAGGTVTPRDGPDGGLRDERVAVTAVLYPQPFGFEVEYTFGRGPELDRDRTRLEVNELQGGYALVNFKIETPVGVILPFYRWQYFDGARKFARNAPRVNLNESDIGVEFQPLKELEIVVQYTYTKTRSDTNTAPYDELHDAHRVGFQVQWNY